MNDKLVKEITDICKASAIKHDSYSDRANEINSTLADNYGGNWLVRISKDSFTSAISFSFIHGIFLKFILKNEIYSLGVTNAKVDTNIPITKIEEKTRGIEVNNTMYEEIIEIVRKAHSAKGPFERCKEIQKQLESKYEGAWIVSIFDDNSDRVYRYIDGLELTLTVTYGLIPLTYDICKVNV